MSYKSGWVPPRLITTPSPLATTLLESSSYPPWQFSCSLGLTHSLVALRVPLALLVPQLLLAFPWPRSHRWPSVFIHTASPLSSILFTSAFKLLAFRPSSWFGEGELSSLLARMSLSRLCSCVDILRMVILSGGCMNLLSFVWIWLRYYYRFGWFFVFRTFVWYPVMRSRLLSSSMLSEFMSLFLHYP